MKKIKAFLKSFFIFFTVFSLLFTLQGVTAFATEEKTDYYELKEGKNGSYTLNVYGIVDWSIISEKNIDTVVVYNAELKDLSAFPYSDRVTSIRFENCQIESLRGLEFYPAIKSFELFDSDVQDISSISSLKSLTSVTLSNMDITDLSLIANPQNIESYFFTRCNFKDLTVIPYSPVLNQITFYRCNMESISGIERFTSLSKLYFSAVGIEDISLVAELENLVDVAFEYTQVKDLTPLENLPKLKILDIDNCLLLESLDCIKNIKSLKELLADNCQMVLTEELLEYLKSNKIKTDFTERDLQIKNDVIGVYNSLELENLTEKEKIKVITQYVLDNMEYDFDSASKKTGEGIVSSRTYNDNAYYYALKGKGCCRNYSALTTALMLMAGIEVYECKSDNHIWNLVKSENEYYWIDTTWIDVLNDGTVEGSKDYMTQSTLFSEEHPCVSFPVGYYIEMNKEPERVTEENEQEPQNTQSTKPEILIIIAVLLFVSLLISPQKSRRIKEEEL